MPEIVLSDKAAFAGRTVLCGQTDLTQAAEMVELDKVGGGSSPQEEDGTVTEAHQLAAQEQEGSNADTASDEEKTKTLMPPRTLMAPSPPFFRGGE